MNIKLDRITKDNLELACKIQNTIFPEEDGRQNFIEQINQDPYRKKRDKRSRFFHRTKQSDSCVWDSR